LAWGTQEQQVLHYDPAINLRLGRDLARAGGAFGLGDQFFVPSGLRSNLHNDLIATYIAGYLGLVVLAITMLAYALFYLRLLGGLAWSLDSLNQQNKSNPSQDARRILIATAAAISVTYGIQALWMVAAALQQSVPLTGLDLQPISASNISLVNFFAVLSASVALAHNVCKT
jgi:cell division protein FtsW (lipid II flippase)